MKTLRHITLLLLCLTTVACAAQGPAQGSASWDTMKYSDFAAMDGGALMRMGK